METEKLVGSPIGSIVAEDSRYADVFKKYAIDYCFKGGTSLEEVCKIKKLDLNILLDELVSVSLKPSKDKTDYRSWSVQKLIDYIISNHHKYIYQNRSVIENLISNALEVTKEKELVNELNQLFHLACDDLEAILQMEELRLFPAMITRIEMGIEKESIAQLIMVMESDHEDLVLMFNNAKELVARINAAESKCREVQELLLKLSEFEEDLYNHFHIENNILFKKV